jgi:hypothetical protein
MPPARELAFDDSNDPSQHVMSDLEEENREINVRDHRCEGRSSFPTTSIRMGCFASWSVQPCSCAGCAGCGVAHSAGPFSQEWAVTSRRTHGPPEDLLDDWGQLRVAVVFPPDHDTARAPVGFIRPAGRPGRFALDYASCGAVW